MKTYRMVKLEPGPVESEHIATFTSSVIVGQVSLDVGYPEPVLALYVEVGDLATHEIGQYLKSVSEAFKGVFPDDKVIWLPTRGPVPGVQFCRFEPVE